MDPYMCLYFETASIIPTNIMIEKSPAEVLGDFTISGALPEHNLVMLSSINTNNTDENKNLFLKTFNRDNEVLYGNIVIIKTDDLGNPTNISIKEYENIIKQ